MNQKKSIREMLASRPKAWYDRNERLSMDALFSLFLTTANTLFIIMEETEMKKTLAILLVLAMSLVLLTALLVAAAFPGRKK